MALMTPIVLFGVTGYLGRGFDKVGIGRLALYCFFLALTMASILRLATRLWL
jgi:hypothetical protein